MGGEDVRPVGSSEPSNIAITPVKPRSSRQHGSRRFRGLICANCRIRKVRCEGGQPTCKTCEVYHDNCQYDKAPPLSQVVALARRLQEAEKTIAQLQGGMPEVAAEGTSPPGGSHPSPSPLVVTSADMGASLPVAAAGYGIGSTGAPLVPPAEQGFLQTQMSLVRPVLDATPKESRVIDLSVDEHGKICYYGPTSAVHDPPELDSPLSLPSTCGSISTTTDIRSFLTSHAKESAIWEEFALGNAALRTGIPRQMMANLLHLHWTWVSPMFMWVYRPAFVRDMTTGGRYYSDFLLTVLCAHASKYQDGHYAELLLSRVRELLGAAIQQPSSIPTVQALLQLSARELAHGSISQAWVYSGIAFRMASDLGLQHSGPDISSLKGLDPVGLEIRRRLSWSCYFWDKAISLYTGRLPAVTELPHNPMDVLDDCAELETWSPYYGDSLTLTKLAPGQYPAMKSYAVSCFANSCKISVIINDIIVQLYSRRSRPITEACLKDVRRRLDLWRAQSPAHLNYDPDHLPTVCPPPHILSQNLLYFTTVILAHQPFWSIPAYYHVCISVAQSIEKLLLLLESTFGLENITYLMGYCIYTGASAILEDAKNNDGVANVTMQTYLRALNTGMRRCPLLERSLHIIVKGLTSTPVQRAQTNQSGLADATSTNSYIPAFPYFDPTSPSDFDMDAYLSSTGMDTMAMLDCFPETQIDLGELMSHAPC